MNNNVRENTWDTDLFGVKTFEVIDTQVPCDELNEAIKSLESEGEYVLMARADANDMERKKLLSEAGFQVMETSLDIFLPMTKSYQIPKIYASKSLNLSHADEKDQLELKDFVGDTFEYSRFHEDPLFDRAKASQRMQNRIDVFIQTNSHKCLVHKTPNGEVVSFIYYLEKENDIYFELGGSKLGKGHYTPFFWASLIEYFRAQGKKKIRTRISAANIGVANIYWSFGFKISTTVLDYHKHVTK